MRSCVTFTFASFECMQPLNWCNSYKYFSPALLRDIYVSVSLVSAQQQLPQTLPQMKTKNISIYFREKWTNGQKSAPPATSYRWSTTKQRKNNKQRYMGPVFDGLPQLGNIHRHSTHQLILYYNLFNFSFSPHGARRIHDTRQLHKYTIKNQSFIQESDDDEEEEDRDERG